jgi:hypothetical protein
MHLVIDRDRVASHVLLYIDYFRNNANLAKNVFICLVEGVRDYNDYRKLKIYCTQWRTRNFPKHGKTRLKYNFLKKI